MNPHVRITFSDTELVTIMKAILYMAHVSVLDDKAKQKGESRTASDALRIPEGQHVTKADMDSADAIATKVMAETMQSLLGDIFHPENN